ncbi:MAG: FKBP-type peptidyl-prolyl cis-trans isomerase [Gemmatimonadaceae bacterium]
MAVMEMEKRLSKHTHSRTPSAAAKSRRRTACAVVLLVTVALLGLTGCGGSSPAPATAPAPRPVMGPVERTTFAPSLGVHLDQMLRHGSGLYVQDLKVGTGAVALKGKSMVVRYAGYLANGTEFDHGEITVQIGGDNTIAAWKEGLLGMRVGGQRRLVVPPSLGYGTAAAGEIPANSVLVFDIEMMSTL